MRKRYGLWLVALAIGGLPSVALSQPVGYEVQVNTYTTDDQQYPFISSDANGTFVMVWESAPRGNHKGQDGSQTGIFGGRYDSSRNRRLGGFRANTYTTGNQRFPVASSDPAGNFVVVWASYGQDGNGYGVFGQRYASDGSRLGGEFQVNTYATGRQKVSSVSSDTGGNFVVVWESYGQDGSDYGVFGQRYASDGNPLGDEFRVNTYTTGSQRFASVSSTDPTGNFVVVWASDGQDGDDYGVFGQRYESDGSPLGAEFQVNTSIGSDQDHPSVASNGSGFVVAWGDTYGFGYPSVSAQRYSSNGDRLGSEFQVTRYTGYYGGPPAPHVAYSSNGDFVVVWDVGYRVTDWWMGKAFGREYDDGGDPLGSEFRVNVRRMNTTQLSPRVAADSHGGFVVVYTGDLYHGKSDYDIAARRISGQSARSDSQISSSR